MSATISTSVCDQVEPTQQSNHHTMPPRTLIDGLHALIAAAETLERQSSPYLDTSREKRKIDMYLRRIDQMHAPKKCKRTPASTPVGYVGSIIWKEFYDEDGKPRMYQGQVMSVSCATRQRPFHFGPGVTATVKYSVLYEDGDAEDMTHADLLKYLIV
jgi:hypothetical protein